MVIQNFERENKELLGAYEQQANEIGRWKATVEDMQQKLDKKGEMVKEWNKTIKVIKNKSKEVQKLKQELLNIKKIQQQD